MINFVGAGPGAADLITIRGHKLLSEADVIIYAGSLVNPQLLDYKKESCEVYNSAYLTLEEVLDVMEKAEQQNKMTVRLHTGDPSIYGAIREQMDLLDKKNILYSVTPGVSSFIGAASSLNAEFTLPNVSQTVILTRMEGRTPVPSKEDISLLAAHNATMVVFLSTAMIGKLSEKLINGGYLPSTKAAIVYKATWEDEKVVRTTVADLQRAADENNIKKTALILVGEFLGSEYERSRLYDPTFTHEFRTAETPASNEGCSN